MKYASKARPLIASTAILVILGISWLYLRILAGEIKEHAVSPDGAVIAESRSNGSFAAATDAAVTTVELKTKFNPFRHAVLVGLDYGATVNISWNGSKNLIVKCSNCNSLDVKRREQKWHDISITYQVD